MEDPRPSWRIDTLDARGGLAFASQRKADLLSGDVEGGEPPVIFVGAPDFQPEPVVSRAIALAAGRGSFQTGLFVKGAEVPFPTPADVAEFVRRCYLSSGGGDGGDAGGPTPPPRPPGPKKTTEQPEGPDGSKSQKGGAKKRRTAAFVENTYEAISRFKILISSLTVGQATQFAAWPPDAISADPSTGGPGPSESPDLLASAAVDLMQEMVQRLPRDDAPDAHEQFLTKARYLGEVITHLGLWPILVHGNRLDPVAKQLYKSTEQSRYLSAGEKQTMDDQRLVLFGLFLGWPIIRNPHYSAARIRHLFITYQHLGLIPPTSPTYETSVVSAIQDPVSGLSGIPLPLRLANFVEPAIQDKASLFHSLAFFAGSPGEALRHGHDLFKLVLFASAYIASIGRTSRPSLYHMVDQLPDETAQPTATEQAVVHRNATHGWTWLREQLPRIAFAEPVEAAIAQSRNTRYG